MYPLYDPEGQLEAHKYMLKRLEEGRDSKSSFLSTLIASIIAAAITPTALFVYFTLSEAATSV